MRRLHAPLGVAAVLALLLGSSSSLAERPAALAATAPVAPCRTDPGTH
jgi:hypothetical protein